MGLLLIVFMICTAVLFSGYRRITASPARPSRS